MNNPVVPSGEPATRFVVDHMLIKLGKYLRIVGCDAAWDHALRTHELIEWSNRESRVFLSRNRHLPYAYPHADRSYRVVATDPVEQLREVSARFTLPNGDRLFSRCIRCNVALDLVAVKQTIHARVHPGVYGCYARFYTCPSCGTVFWKGTHVANTCRKLGITGETGAPGHADAPEP